MRLDRICGYIRAAAAVVMLMMLCLPLPLAVLQNCFPAPFAVFNQQPLYGVIPPPQPAFSLAGLRSTAFQRSVEQYLERSLVARNQIIRLTNQIYYNLFAKSYMYSQVIVIGRNHTLFEKAYIDAYCSDQPGFMTSLEPLVSQLAKLSTELRAIKRPMVVVITPSKAVTMPELLPRGVCPEPPTNPATRAKVFADALRAAGVTVVDGATTVRAMKIVDPLPPFPRGGTHWSLYAGHRVATDVLQALDRSGYGDLGDISLGPPHLGGPPQGSDGDLAQLLNLYAPPLDYPTANADVLCHRTTTGNETSLIVVGGSFASALFRPYEICGLFKDVSVYSYYRTLIRGTTRRPVRPGLENWQAVFATRTAVIVELNELFLGGTPVPWLGPFLKDALAAFGADGHALN